MTQKQQILRIFYKIDLSHIFHRLLLDLKLMNSNHKFISTNIIMLITESQYSDNSAMTNKKNSAATNENNLKMTNFENFLQNKSFIHFSQIINKFEINEY